MAADRQISRIIYALKRQRGIPAVVQRESVSTNVTTGEVVTTITTSVAIRRIVQLPKKFTAAFLQNQTYTAAGSFYNKAERYFLIDARDLGSFVLKNDSDVIVISKRRYVIRDVEEYDEAGKVVVYAVTAVDIGAQPDVQS